MLISRGTKRSSANTDNKSYKKNFFHLQKMVLSPIIFHIEHLHEYIIPTLTKISIIEIPAMSKGSLDSKHLPGFVCRPIKIKRKFIMKSLSQKTFQA